LHARALLLAAVIAAAPHAAIACSVCQGGTADNRIEFIATTAFLTFLPLALIGGVIYGLRRKYLGLAHQETRDDGPRIEPRVSVEAAPTR
jgi:hypothetical protein